jgi:hypothetical protein
MDITHCCLTILYFKHVLESIQELCVEKLKLTAVALCNIILEQGCFFNVDNTALNLKKG